MKNKTCGECRHFEVDVVAPTCTEKFWITDDNTPACKMFEPIVVRNGDVIRQMDTSGLIDVIVCPYPNKVCIHRCMKGYACRCCKRDWLNAPAESEGKDE